MLSALLTPAQARHNPAARSLEHGQPLPGLSFPCPVFLNGLSSQLFALEYNKGFPCGSAGKESAFNVGDLGSFAGLGRSPGEGKGYPL